MTLQEKYQKMFDSLPGSLPICETLAFNDLRGMSEPTMGNNSFRNFFCN